MAVESKPLAEAPVRRARGRPRTEDLEALEVRLVQVARQCFIDKGYGATSMSEVARLARVSKTTLYSRFPSKADLFRGILDDQIRRSGGGFHLPGPRPKALETVLRGYAEHMLQESLHSDILHLNRLIVSEAERFPELGEAAHARGQIGIDQVAEYIRDYAETEHIPCREPSDAAEIFIALLRGWYSGAMLRSRAVSAAEIRAWIRRMLPIFLASRSAW